MIKFSKITDPKMMNEKNIYKLGTQIRFSDGREATVVYNSLIGVGVKWGLHNPSPEDFLGTDGNTTTVGTPKDWQWNPDVLLRAPWSGCQQHGFKEEDCIDLDYEILK